MSEAVIYRIQNPPSDDVIKQYLTDTAVRYL
jgi:hypothetical protein